MKITNTRIDETNTRKRQCDYESASTQQSKEISKRKFRNYSDIDVQRQQRNIPFEENEKGNKRLHTIYRKQQTKTGNK